MLLVPFLLVVGLAASTAFGATDIIELDDNSDQINLANHIEYQIDSSGQLTVNDMQASSRRSLWQHPVKVSDSISFGYTQDIYWFHFRLKNIGTHTIRKQLEIGYPVLDYIDVFQLFDNGNSVSHSMGDKRPFLDRPVRHRNFILPLQLHAGDLLDVYIRVHTTSSMQLPIMLWRALWMR